MDITIKQTVSLERVADVLCSAVDAGHEAIGYWGEVRTKKEPTAWTYRPKDAEAGDGKVYRHYYPLNEGGALVIRDNEADGAQYTLNLKAVKRGLELMAKEYPTNFADIIEENDDNETADILVQLALFDEVIYG